MWSPDSGRPLFLMNLIDCCLKGLKCQFFFVLCYLKHCWNNFSKLPINSSNIFYAESIWHSVLYWIFIVWTYWERKYFLRIFNIMLNSSDEPLFYISGNVSKYGNIWFRPLLIEKICWRMLRKCVFIKW